MVTQTGRGFSTNPIMSQIHMGSAGSPHEIYVCT
uniref:Zf-CCHH domain-containing protein n=1 Tax=Mesocestoides corti TaxID=53468 RepID=A0A5K3F6L6_MESCO